MRKRILIGLGIALICSILFYVNLAATNNKNAKSAKAPVIIEESNTPDTTKASNTEAFYLDYEDSLDEVKNSADLIIVGTVVEQSEYGETGVKSTIKVTTSIKGTASNEIYVLKSGSLKDNEYILKKDKEYILLLGDQSKSGENTYFIKGGEQGCFLIDGDKLYAKDAVMADELVSGTNQVKAMLEYLSN
jgi:hypothetical protein